MWGSGDFEDDPLEEPLDNSCYLAVGVASNIVAKGTIMLDTHGEAFIEVMLEIGVQGEAFLPIPLEEEFIMKVKDAIGHMLMWPRHLVIRCSELEKVAVKPKRKLTEPNKKETGSKKEKKQPREPLETNNKENEKEHGEKGKAKKEMRVKSEPGQEQIIENVGKGMNIAQSNERVRMDMSTVLTMTALVVDAQLTKEDSIKVLCQDDLFGQESFTYLNWSDFEAVFSMDELTGPVITSYMMFLYEQVKNGQKHDHGICFVSPSAISPADERKAKSKQINDASRMVADRLSKRKGNDIILLPYNPGRHWVLVVLNLKTTTCYYLDSLRPSSVNEQLRQIIDMGMAMYAAQSGTSMRAKLNWVNVRCPRQPGSTECGYYLMKFMKEIAYEGVKILVNDNVGRGIDEYTDADMDEIREEWSGYAALFIFKP